MAAAHDNPAVHGYFTRSLPDASSIETLLNSMRARFTCPSCGFAIYNRRVRNCERCAAVLPPEVAYSLSELKHIDADAQRNDLVRKALAEDAQQLHERRKLRGLGDAGDAGDLGLDDLIGGLGNSD